MSFRQVIVRDASYLSFKDSSLFIHEDLDRDLKETKIVLDEIAIIVIENHKSTLTVNLINRCSENNIVIIVCDEQLLPKTLIYPFTQHYRQLKNVYLQLELKTVKKQNLWRFIIQEKIKNQSNVLEITKCSEEKISLMHEYMVNVQRNDSNNREAISAKVFFNAIYGDEFHRFVDEKINHALNYGYSILASSITRQLISYGIDPRFGIWHNSKSNAFNLTYDLIEPFRPIIDYYIKEHYSLVSDKLSIKVRKNLVGILNYPIEVDGNSYRVQNAIEKYVSAFLKFIKGEQDLLPKVNIIKIKFYEFE